MFFSLRKEPMELRIWVAHISFCVPCFSLQFYSIWYGFMEKMYLIWKMTKRTGELYQFMQAVIKNITDWVTSTIEIYILMILDTTSSRSRCQLFQFLVRGLFLACTHSCLSAESSFGRGGLGAGSRSLVSLFKRTLIISFQSLIIMTSFNLCHFFTGSISKHSYIGG